MSHSTNHSEKTFSLGDNDPNMNPRDLTLIVAATNKMGIGRSGTLPWTGLKKEMAYFARVTKRAGPTVSRQESPAIVFVLIVCQATNAVIMGRKTWESIPPRFRPLKDRLNVVITRDSLSDSASQFEGAAQADSIESAINFIGSTILDRRAFVIGGAQIYKAALEMKEARRILLTRVLSDFECDTFFPVELGENGKGERWVRRTKEELDSWVGESVPEGVQEENGTKYVFEMWERTD
jgi:dihydrofolate reductase